MSPRARAAGIAGVLAGLGLIGEFVLFTVSGSRPSTLQHASTALPFLQEHGTAIRAAALLGAANAALAVIFLAGLAARLHAKAPTLAVATLYFGIIGAAGDALVAISLWLGTPSFTQLAASDHPAASPAWEAFAAVINAFGGFGNLFLGLSLLAAGSAIASTKALPATVGWIALIAGAATLARILGLDPAFLVSLILATVFRIWTGIHLWRSARAA
jgi:Domain of unknown function (DUF4386)